MMRCYPLMFIVLFLPSLATAAPTWPLRQTLDIGLLHAEGAYGRSTVSRSESLFWGWQARWRRSKLDLQHSLLAIRGPVANDSAISCVGPCQTTGSGDLYLKGEWYTRPRMGFTGSISGRMKIPLTGRQQRLGTGEPDADIGLSLARSLGPWTPYLRIGYQWRGDPVDIALYDRASLQVATTYALGKRLSLGLSADLRSRSHASSEARRELSWFGSWRASPRWHLTLFTLAGFSDASPAWAMGSRLSRHFTRRAR